MRTFSSWTCKWKNNKRHWQSVKCKQIQVTYKATFPRIFVPNELSRLKYFHHRIDLVSPDEKPLMILAQCGRWLECPRVRVTGVGLERLPHPLMAKKRNKIIA